VRDENLIEAIRLGDTTASERLARRYYTDLHAYFCSRINRQDAEDLTQLTLMNTVAQVDRFRNESSFRHYVFTVAGRALFEKCRHTMRRIDTEEPGSEPPGNRTTPSEGVYRTESRKRLLAAIGQVRQPFREVVELSLGGMDNFEIAEQLGLEYNTVRSRLSRGLALVREALASASAERERVAAASALASVSAAAC
jgi:RNA polymerase sigma-70 factor (ECF subfamily)